MGSTDVESGLFLAHPHTGDGGIDVRYGPRLGGGGGPTGRLRMQSDHSELQTLVEFTLLRQYIKRFASLRYRRLSLY